MASDPYCGNCHDWMTELFPDRWVCDCTVSGQAADKSKDPNCHNSTHAHHDPESPIVLSNRAIRDAEEATELEAIRKREEAAAAEETFEETREVLDGILEETNEQILEA